MQLSKFSPILFASLLVVTIGTKPAMVLASGTLSDIGVQVQTFADGSGGTPISAEHDGNFIYTASGGSPAGNRFARYMLDGTLDLTFASGIDFRSLYTDNGGQLFAKAFGSGNVYSLTTGGVATPLYNLSDPNSQSSASLNGDDTELYTRDGNQLRRYNAANGLFLGSFTLIGMTAGELGFPDFVQMETNDAGRIFTYSGGVVSEWDLGGNRIGTSTIPIATPSMFNTEWSFGVASDDLIYLLNSNTNNWESYDVGILGLVDVDIDIKFCSNPNAHNCKSGGVLPVTIFGSEDLDVTTIDLESLQLCRDDTGECTDLGSAIDSKPPADRGDPTLDLGTEECVRIDSDGDGILDLDIANPDGFDDLDVGFDKRAVSALLDICDDLGMKGDLSVPLFIQGASIFSTPVDLDGVDILERKNR